MGMSSLEGGELGPLLFVHAIVRVFPGYSTCADQFFLDRVRQLGREVEDDPPGEGFVARGAVGVQFSPAGCFDQCV